MLSPLLRNALRADIWKSISLFSACGEPYFELEGSKLFCSLEMLKAFIGAEEGASTARKSISLAIGVAVYHKLDWALVGLTASLVALLKYYNVRYGVIVLLLWVGNLFLSWLVVLCNDKIQVDFTLACGCRRVVDWIRKKSNIIACVLEVALVLVLTLWYGAGPLYIFLRGRLQGGMVPIIVFMLASAVQMMLWVEILSLGTQLVLDFMV